MLNKPYLRIAAALLALAAAAFGQAQAPAAAPASPPLAFEVASIKPSAPLDAAAIASGKAHLGMSVDKARVDIGGAPLIGLICQAYKIKPQQLSGGPPWLYTERFDILAKMPDGATKDDVPAMLQTLLAERFKLAVHRETKDTSVYALMVAKGGPKLKDAPPDPVAPPAATDTAGGPAESAEAKPPAPAKGEIVMGSGDNQVRVKQSSDGKAIVNSKETGNMKVSMENGIIHMEAERMTIETMIGALSQYLDRPVIDQTELKGKYQITLDIAMSDALRIAAKMGMGAAAAPAANAGKPPGPETPAADDPSGSSLFASVQRLGLKLDPRKLPYEFIVIDHIEKTPTEN